MSQPDEKGKIGDALCLEGVIPRQLYDVMAEVLSFTYEVNKEWPLRLEAEGGEEARHRE